MKVSKRSLFVLILVAVFAASCASPVPAETPDINASLTAGVSTFAAYFFQTQTAMVTPATETPTPTPIPTFTPFTPMSPSPTALVFFPVIATQSLAPAATITGTNYTKTAAPEASGCNNLLLLRDDEISPSSTMKVGTVFTKTWKVQNIGTCDWKLGYRLTFVSGDAMDGAPGGHNVIPPQKTATLTLSLTAPSKEGTYTGYWQMSDGSGKRFGSILGVTITAKTVYP